MRLSVVSLVTLLVIVAAPIHRVAAQAPPPAAPAATRGARAEQHPRIRRAIRELQAAKVELQKAPHDFGGHRADALQAVDRAIEQLRIALQYDKK